jgi:hypothetical protein
MQYVEGMELGCCKYTPHNRTMQAIIMCMPKQFVAMPHARQCYIIADFERSCRELFKSGLNFKKKTEK